MTRLALCLLLLATLAGCEPMTPVHHDDARNVTCWVPWDSRAGLSCLPDWMLKDPGVADNQLQLSPHETQPEPTPAMAPGRWIDERYQL